MKKISLIIILCMAWYMMWKGIQYDENKPLQTKTPVESLLDKYTF